MPSLKIDLNKEETQAAFAPDDYLTFCVVADWHTEDDNFTRLAGCLLLERPDLVLIPGDLVMANGGDPEPWNVFFARVRPMLDARLPPFPVPGNHDLDGDVASQSGGESC